MDHAVQGSNGQGIVALGCVFLEYNQQSFEEKIFLKIFLKMKIHTHATHGEVSEDGLLAVHGGHQDEIFCMILTFYA